MREGEREYGVYGHIESATIVTVQNVHVCMCVCERVSVCSHAR